MIDTEKTVERREESLCPHPAPFSAPLGLPSGNRNSLPHRAKRRRSGRRELVSSSRVGDARVLLRRRVPRAGRGGCGIVQLGLRLCISGEWGLKGWRRGERKMLIKCDSRAPIMKVYQVFLPPSFEPVFLPRGYPSIPKNLNKPHRIFLDSLCL